VAYSRAQGKKRFHLEVCAGQTCTTKTETPIRLDHGVVNGNGQLGAGRLRLEEGKDKGHKGKRFRKY